MIPEVERDANKILRGIDLSSRLEPDNELQSFMAQHLAVLTSGLIETAFFQILTSFTGQRSVPQVTNYVKKQVSGWQNPNPEKIEKLLRSFDDKQFQELDDYWRDERRDAISSIVNIRNQIAHGRNHGVTVQRVHDYFKSVREVIEFIEAIVLR